MIAAPEVAVLFARADSVYKTMAACDVFDQARDARSYDGAMPVVAHPPCRAWSRMRAFAKPARGEKKLALFAIDQVRKCGGVLEHPSGSLLFRQRNLPRPGSTDRDSFGGWVLPISQKWWGHRAEKRTWLYLVGIEPAQLPAYPLVLADATHVVASSRGCTQALKRPEITKPEREHTPAHLAAWLVQIAQQCRA